jgi:hypothetical protein
MDKRKEKRFAEKLHVKLSSGSLITWGVLCDVSENGLFIRSNREFPMGTVVDIEIFLSDNQISFLKGVVRRCIEMPETHRKNGLGIELTEKDITYRHFLRFLNGQAKTSAQTLRSGNENAVL